MSYRLRERPVVPGAVPIEGPDADYADDRTVEWSSGAADVGSSHNSVLPIAAIVVPDEPLVVATPIPEEALRRLRRRRHPRFRVLRGLKNSVRKIPRLFRGIQVATRSLSRRDRRRQQEEPEEEDSAHSISSVQTLGEEPIIPSSTTDYTDPPSVIAVSSASSISFSDEEECTAVADDTESIEQASCYYETKSEESSCYYETKSLDDECLETEIYKKLDLNHKERPANKRSDPEESGPGSYFMAGAPYGPSKSLEMPDLSGTSLHASLASHIAYEADADIARTLATPSRSESSGSVSSQQETPTSFAPAIEEYSSSDCLLRVLRYFDQVGETCRLLHQASMRTFSDDDHSVSSTFHSVSSASRRSDEVRTQDNNECDDETSIQGQTPTVITEPSIFPDESTVISGFDPYCGFVPLVSPSVGCKPHSFNTAPYMATETVRKVGPDVSFLPIVHPSEDQENEEAIWDTKDDATVVSEPATTAVALSLSPITDEVARDVESEPVITGVALSSAFTSDENVYNDTVKVVMVGSDSAKTSWLAKAIAGHNELTQGTSDFDIDIVEWTPSDMDVTSSPAISDHSVKFRILNLHGGEGLNGVDFGAHTGTQSLLFSPKAMNILVWDMAYKNPKTYATESLTTANNHNSLEEADIALRDDICERVLPWVDCLAQFGPESAILPVALMSEGMKSHEALRRSDMMLRLLKEHIQQLAFQDAAPRLLTNGASVTIVAHCDDDDAGVHQLRESMIEAVVGSSQPAFEHFGSAVPRGTMAVLEAIRKLRRDDLEIVELSTLHQKLVGLSLEEDDVTNALCFLSSIGEIMYFGSPNDELDTCDSVLSRYVVLCTRWMVQALSCVLKENLKQKVKNARYMASALGIEDYKVTSPNEATEVLVGDSNSPLLSSNDARLLWVLKKSIKEAAERCGKMTGSSGGSKKVFDFLESALVHAGIFLPLAATCSPSSLQLPKVFLVPSCLSEPAHRHEIWTYKTRESWRTTLCHSWPLQGGVPPKIMEQVTVNLLRDLNDFSSSLESVSADSCCTDGSLSGVFTSPDSPDERTTSLEPIGPVKIHQVMCWKSCLLVKLGAVFFDRERHEPRESSIEVFVALVDESSRYCVASDDFGATTKRLVISGKGEAGQHAQKLWKGGHRVVLDSVLATLLSFKKVSALDCQVACPECLARSDPRKASSWSYYNVAEMAKVAHPAVHCAHGHCVDCRLLCNTVGARETFGLVESIVPPLQANKRLLEITPSVVMVGVWNPTTKKIASVGSGFVANAKRGLVVTAAHVLYCMNAGSQFGCRYSGTVVVGVVPPGQDHAQFSHVAEIVADDVCNVDACVLRIRSSIANGEEEIMPACTNQLKMFPSSSLEMTSHYEREENVRIVGFNQGGEGVVQTSERLDSSVDYTKGHICKFFRTEALINNGDLSDTSSQVTFEPREEIVVERCRTIKGHSGGPCVNDRGEVVGILSRMDPADPRRCYVVPSTELIGLVEEAKEYCT